MVVAYGKEKERFEMHSLEFHNKVHDLMLYQCILTIII